MSINHKCREKVAKITKNGAQFRAASNPSYIYEKILYDNTQDSFAKRNQLKLSGMSKLESESIFNQYAFDAVLCEPELSKLAIDAALKQF